MRKSKQSIIDELERTLKIEQDGLAAERRNLARITMNNTAQIERLSFKINHYQSQLRDQDRLLKIIENLSERRINALPC